MKDIDELIREEMRDAAQTPPVEVWEAVSSRLATQPHAAKARRLRRLVAAGVVMTGIAAVVLVMAGRHSGNDAVKAEVKLVGEEPLPATAEVPAVAVARQERTPDAVMQQTATPSTSKAAPKTTEVAVPVQSKEQQHTETLSAVVPVSAPAKLTPTPADAGEEVNTASESVQQEVNKATAVAAGDTQPRQAAKREPVVPELMIPTLLTPNGDGINDCWIISGLELYGQAQVQIYTAQSQRVYSNNDYRNDFCGDGLPEGNYFYVLVLRDYNYSRRGVFVIKK